MAVCKYCGVSLTEDNWYPASFRQNYYACKSCQCKRSKENYASRKPQVLKQKKGYYRQKRKFILVASHERWVTNKEIVLLHYTRIFDPDAIEPHCRDIFHKHLPNCPLAKDIRALSIDHIEGGGNKHLKAIGTQAIYPWLIKNNFPEGYQVLCMCCQFIKRAKNGELKRV